MCTSYAQTSTQSLVRAQVAEDTLCCCCLQGHRLSSPLTGFGLARGGACHESVPGQVEHVSSSCVLDWTRALSCSFSSSSLVGCCPESSRRRGWRRGSGRRLSSKTLAPRSPSSRPVTVLPMRVQQRRAAARSIKKIRPADQQRATSMFVAALRLFSRHCGLSFEGFCLSGAWQPGIARCRMYAVCTETAGCGHRTACGGRDDVFFFFDAVRSRARAAATQ